MTIKQIYSDDLINRNPGFTFLETLNGSQTTVAFRDAGLATVTSCTNSNIDVCYQQIRLTMVGTVGDALLRLTSAQRDALTGTVDGAQINNIDTFVLEFFSNSAWHPIGQAQAYGSMFEDNSGGSTLVSASSYSGWVTAAVGILDDNTIITFNDNSTADFLEVGTGGAGDYKVSFNASFTNAGSNLTTAAIHLGNNEQVAIKDSVEGDSSIIRNLTASGILTAADIDEIDLRFMSSGSDDIVLFQVSVSIERS